MLVLALACIFSRRADSIVGVPSRNLSNNFIESVFVDTDNASVIPYVLYVVGCDRNCSKDLRRCANFLLTFGCHRDVSNNPITSMSMESAQVIFLYAQNISVRNMTDVSISNSTIYL